jgi:hypothetical protein
MRCLESGKSFRVLCLSRSRDTNALVISSYLHGIMDGEAIEDEEKGRYVYEEFALK